VSSPAPTASPKPAPKATRRGGELDRRTVVAAALILFGTLIVGIVAMAIFADPGSEPAPADAGAPHIIDKPNSGSAPTRSGDRGGAEQLLLLAGIVIAIGGIGYVAFRGGSGAKANRERWRDAAASGQDGALDG
jgi:hypothetical protein